LPSYEEVLEEFNSRKEINDEEQEKERREKVQKKRPYDRRRGFQDGEVDVSEELKDEGPFTLEKPIQPYVRVVGKKTELVLPENPDQIMEIIEDYCNSKSEEEEVKLDVDEKLYKAKLIHAKHNVEIGIRIYRVDDQDLFSIDFTRKQGDLISFLSVFKDLKTYIEFKFGYIEELPQQEETE
jgi:hypothetical protein